MRIGTTNYINNTFYKKDCKKEKTNSQSALPCADYNTGVALKNQILFKGINKYRRTNLEDFQKKYGLNFSDIQLLDNAFTYDFQQLRSNKHQCKTNQETIFIGDGVFKLCTDILIYRDNPQADAGELTKNAQLFKKEKYAKKLKLNNLTLNYNIFNDYSTQKDKKMFEALIGAIYLNRKNKEEGLKDVLDFFDRNLYSKEKNEKNIPAQKSNYKDLLYKYVGKRYRGTKQIRRETVQEEKGHKCDVFIDDELIKSAFAPYKKEAEELASKLSFEYLYKNHPIDMDAKPEKYVPEGRSKFTQKEFKKNIADFQKKYGLDFSNEELLEKIFGKLQNINFRRLEFLGDGILDYYINDFLIENYPKKSIQEMQGMKSNLVSNASLAKMADDMGFKKLKNDYGLLVSEKKYADMVEALLGAILIDGKENGLKNVNNFMTKLIQDGIITI